MALLRLATWIFVIGYTALLWTIVHWGVRTSDYYKDAVAQHLVENPELTESDISLCVFCTSRIQSAGNTIYYHFTLIVEHGTATKQIRIDGSAPRY